MKAPITLPFRYRAPPSIDNLIQIQNGTFYRQHPASLQDSNTPLFSNLYFSLPAFPPKRDALTGKQQQHWAVVGASGGSSTFLEILRGTHICLPPNARTFPYLSSKDIEAKDYRLRSPSRAIQYVGFTSGRGQALGASIRGAYLSARYESRREETDWSVLQYLKGETELNLSEELHCKDTSFDALLRQVIRDLRLEQLTSLPVSNLSNGQTRRARIAKALLGRPEVLLLDEPFMGLDPPTLVSLSPILRELAYKSSPRLIMSLRPQDSIPEWITHLAILGDEYTLALAGPKKEVLFAVHRWADAHKSPKDGTAAKMAALMTNKYGQPPLDFGYTLSATGVFRDVSFSRIMSSRNPTYILPTDEVVPEHLNAADRLIWQKAAEKPREKADLDDLLALTCLLPADFSHQEDVPPLSNKASSMCEDRRRSQPNSGFSTTELPISAHPELRKSVIELKNVVVSYGSKTVLGHAVQAGFQVPGLNLNIRQGTRLALLGPNGSGKTTLLSLLTSDHPQSYSLPIKYFGRSHLPSRGKPGVSLWEIQSRIGHSSPEIHAFFPKGLTIRRSLESAWAETFAAKPKLADNSKVLVDAFLRWWEPELNPYYQPPPPLKAPNTLINGLVSSVHPPFKPSSQTANELEWASSPLNTFGTLSFQSQRLLLLLRAIIKNPDIVILDEAFSGFSPEARDKAMLFLRTGVDVVPHQHPASTYGIRMNGGGGLEYAFHGLSHKQALIVVSHVREEIPDLVNEYLRLPGEEEVGEQGRGIEMGECGDGSLKTVEGWNRIWGLGH